MAIKTNLKAKTTEQQQQQANEFKKVWETTTAFKGFVEDENGKKFDLAQTEKGGEKLIDVDKDGNERVIGTYWVDKQGVLRANIGKGVEMQSKRKITADQFLEACSVLYELGFKGAIQLCDSNKDNPVGEGYNAIRSYSVPRTSK